MATKIPTDTSELRPSDPDATRALARPKDPPNDSSHAPSLNAGYRISCACCPVACKYEPPTKEPDADVSKHVLKNLISLVCIGVAISAWLLYFTDWFGNVVTLLTLGGIVSWLAFMLKVIPEGHLKSFQTMFYRSVLDRSGLQVWVALLATLLLLLSFAVGSVELTLAEGDSDRAVYFYDPSLNGPPVDYQPSWVAKGKPERFVFLSSVLGGEKVIKVDGYPELVIAIRGLTRLDLRAPTSLRRRPILLLTPSTTLMDVHGNNEVDATVTVGRATYRTKLGARSIWVGCDENVEVPEPLVQRWVLQTEPKYRDWVRTGWCRPRGLDSDSTHGAIRNLLVGTIVTISYPGKSQSYTVGPPRGFPQIEEIKE